MTTLSTADGIELRTNGEAADITGLVDRFVWIESAIRGGLTWELTVRVDYWKEWSKLVLSDPLASFEFRLKTTVNGAESSTEWRTAYSDSANMSFRSTAQPTTIRGGDRRLLMQQRTRQRLWRQTTLNEITTALAPNYNMVAQADETPIRRDFYQLHETDWDFLRRITYESATLGGRGDLFLWVDERTLNLRAPNLQLPSVRRHDLSVVENRVDSLALRYSGRNVDRAGGATLLAVGFNFDLKTGVTFTVSAPLVATQPALASRVPRDPANGARMIPVSETTSAGVEGRARARWARFGPRYFTLSCATRPDLTLHPGTIIEVQASRGEGQETPFLGRFLVLEVQHAFVRGAMLTTAVCYRREAYSGAAEPTGVRAQNVATVDPYRGGAGPQANTVTIPAETIR